MSHVLPRYNNAVPCSTIAYHANTTQYRQSLIGTSLPVISLLTTILLHGTTAVQPYGSAMMYHGSTLLVPGYQEVIPSKYTVVHRIKT